MAIGTGLALLGGSVASGVLGASSANKAAKAQEAAANRDIEFQKETRDLIRADLDPYRMSGLSANNALAFENGLGPRPEGYGGFTKTPGYDFRMGQGVGALEAGAAARGGLYSGAAMKSLNAFGQDYATSEYQPYLARLQQQQGVGLSAASMNANAAQNTASGVSNALGNIGNAQAAGAIGSASALNQGIANGIGVWNYQKQLAAGPRGGLFGGNSWGV